MTYYNQNSNPLIQQIFGRAQSTSAQTPMPASTPQLNEQSMAQLYTVVSTIDKAGWQRLIRQAQARGIPREQIEQGLEILLQYK